MSRLDMLQKIIDVGRLDMLQKTIDADEPINPKAEEILKKLFDKAIPMTDYIDTHNIAEAIFGDAMEDLSATNICTAIEKMCNSGMHKDYALFAGGVYYLARAQLAFERSDEEN